MGKKFFALVGCPGAGKSSFVKANGFEDVAISADAIREEIGCAVINEDGTGYIDQSRNKEVFFIFNQRLDDLLKKNDTIVVDNTNLNSRGLKDLRKKAEDNGFSFEVVLFDIPLSILLERNTKRGYKNVPKDVVLRMYKQFLELDFSGYYIAKTITEADQK